MKIKNEYIRNAADNIARYYEKEAALGERMSANLSELSSFVAEAAAKEARTSEFFLGDAPLERFLPPLPTVLEASKGVLDANSALVKAKLTSAHSAYLADFCVKTTAALRRRTRIAPAPALFAERTSEKIGGRVSFAESRQLSDAFAAFFADNNSLSASCVRSFTAACEDVAAGVSDYCILPIENTREGVLPTMYSLIERYELFILKVCVIKIGDFLTKFALLCRSFRDIMKPSEQQYVCLRLSGQDASLWSQLYTGASAIGVEVTNTISVPLGYTDGYAHICTFWGGSDKLFAFLLFLSTIRAGYSLMGAYEILN